MPKKEKFKHDHSSTIYLQVVGSGSYGAPRSLYVFTDHCRYFFNCGEGTQRLSSEHKVKLSLTEHIFITHKTWENVGGLPGTLLTLQDSGVNEITIHGPPGIESLYKDTKHFMRFTELNVKYCHYNTNGGVLDKGPIHIQSVPLWPDDNSTLNGHKENFQLESEEIEDLFAHENEKASDLNEDPKCLDARNGSDRLSTLKESSKCKELALAYICRPTPKPGALLPSRCRELGVPLGPMMGELKKGKDVTLANGNIVKAVDVTDPPDLGIVFIVIDLPTKSHLGALLASADFSLHQERLAGSKKEDIAGVVVHFTSADIVEQPLYQKWINDFGPSTTHIYVNENSSCMGSESVHKLQYKLNHIYPDSFPLLNDSIEGCLANCDKEEEERISLRSCKRQKLEREDACYDKKNLIRERHWQAFTNLIYHIRPHLRIEESKRIRIDPKEFIRECYNVKDFESIYRNVRNKVKQIKTTIPNDVAEQFYPFFIFLGTGSCIPNKTRNTSGIAFYINSNSTMLLDCGEGTLGQLIRHLGKASAFAFLSKLSIVYISHLHADHHIGFIRILLGREKALKTSASTRKVPEKLMLLAPKNIMHYLSSYSVNFESIVNQFTLIPNDTLMTSPSEEEEDDTLMEHFTALGIQFVQTCFVYHCPHAYGVAITLQNGWKVAYSGDTLPCQALVHIGKDCDLLIHEATMEDDLKDDAKAKRHSTTSEAIEMGIQMKAKNVILTHFSQRYAKVPLLENIPENVCIAFDNMVLHLSDLHCLFHLYTAYVSIFSEDVDEILKKRMKIRTKNDNSKNKILT